MSWIAYKIVLRVKSPLHIGLAKLGNLQRTRSYVHGRALWGALTARMTRDTPVFNNDYRYVGKRVNEELAFSYFFPTTGDSVTLWPWDDRDKFAWHYLNSYASTALDYGRNAAKESSLHETEYIAPTTRNGAPVFLVGYLFEAERDGLPWRDALTHLQMGGERGYGWGRFSLESCDVADAGLFGAIPIELDGARPTLELGQDAKLLAHVHASGNLAVAAHGRLAPLVGRETHTSNAFGRHHSQAVVCWEPGSITDSPQRVVIGPYGIWNQATP